MTSTELLSLPKLPKSLLILGGGVIGCEFACLFAELGVNVTVVEMLPQILPQTDGECAKLLAREMSRRGIRILNGTPLSEIKCTARGASGRTVWQGLGITAAGAPSRSSGHCCWHCRCC